MSFHRWVLYCWPLWCGLAKQLATVLGSKPWISPRDERTHNKCPSICLQQIRWIAGDRYVSIYVCLLFFHLVVSSEACSAASHRTIRQQFVHAQNFRVRTVLAPAVCPYEVFCGSNRSTILCTLNRKAVTWEGFLGQSFGRKRGTQIVV